MLKIIVLGAALALGAATVADAAVMPQPIDQGASSIVRIAEDCGPGRWRDAHGVCHWFHGGSHHACPPWHHWWDGRCVHD